MSEIAGRVGVPLGVAYHQLAFALLVGDLPRVASEEAAPAITLDRSQEEAAFIASGPVLVEAGPGTGKTRTLVARVVHLLGQGVDPNAILALTFSNKAAEEMRSRIAAVAPDAAPLIWIGTFHAFGLELLRKHGSSISLPPDPVVLDPVDGMLLLERELPNLRLEHYQYLPEPTLYLKDILTAISRAKDELVEPERYRQAALAMREAARGEEEVVAAEKALEVADVYQAYQSFLERDQAFDFGDLIARSVGLLGASADIRKEVRSRFRHVLVDEYQDVNRASARLLQAIAGDAKGLWVVGDARQSIYRFRGAAPANMATFADDFPGAVVLRLADNYRTQPAVLKAVNAYAAAMPALPGRPFEPWTPRRPQTDGRVTMEIAADAEAEGLGIAAEIREHVPRNVPYRDQAVLCRSHLNLARLGEYLEQAGVPVLYLGDLFERPEIRDLLALLSMMCFRDGRGLVRVARFPEYSIPLADVRALYRFASEQEVAFPDALARAAALPADQSPVSAKGRRGVALLARHLERVSFGTEAWTMLVRYLLEDAGYLRGLAADQSAGGQQRRLAVYQFLQFAQEQRRRSGPAGGAPHNVDPKRMFLQLVRRLAMLGDDSQLRQVPEWAADIDAVRLLTVHSSKAALRRLGRGYSPLVDPDGHKRAFEAFLAREHAWIDDQLRRKFWDAFLQAASLTEYVSARGREGLTPDPAWLDEYALPPEDIMRHHVERWLAVHGNGGRQDIVSDALEVVRNANRDFLDDLQERLRDTVLAWCTKHSATMPEWWAHQASGTSWLTATAYEEGWTDFRMLDESSLVRQLQARGRWPTSMPSTLTREALSLTPADVDLSRTRRDAEKHRREQARRSIVVDGAAVIVEPGDFRGLAKALLPGLTGKLLDTPDRIGRLEIADTGPSYGSGTAGRRGMVSMSSLTDDQRLGVGFAGELVVREWLGRHYQALDIDEHWKSGYKNAFLGRSDGDDGLGYDFEIITSARRRLYEVKASIGEDWQFAMGESEVRVAQRFSADQKVLYRVIYIANVLDSSRRQLIVLPNPFGRRGGDRLRMVGSGMRFKFVPS